MRLPQHLDGLGGLIIPGGESTTLSRLMSLYHLREPIKGMARQGKVIWGTCAGMIMMAQEITEGDPVPLGLMDIGVLRKRIRPSSRQLRGRPSGCGLRPSTISRCLHPSTRYHQGRPGGKGTVYPA